jgi:hypothetical protein
MYFFNVSYWTAVFERTLLPLALASHWLEEFANCTLTEEKVTNAAPPTQLQQANQFYHVLLVDYL